MPRHVPSSFVASEGNEFYCPMHLMPDVETSLKTLDSLYKDPSPQALVDAVSKS